MDTSSPPTKTEPDRGGRRLRARCAARPPRRQARPIGACRHSDPAALAALLLGEWAALGKKRWAKFFNRFDRVIAQRLYRLAPGRPACPGRVRPRSTSTSMSSIPCGPTARWCAATSTCRPIRAFWCSPATRRGDLKDPGQRRGRRSAPATLMLMPPKQTCAPASGGQLGYMCANSKQLARLMLVDTFVHAGDQAVQDWCRQQALALGPAVEASAWRGLELVDEVAQRAHEATGQNMAGAIDALFRRPATPCRAPPTNGPKPPIPGTSPSGPSGSGKRGAGTEFCGELDA